MPLTSADILPCKSFLPCRDLALAVGACGESWPAAAQHRGALVAKLLAYLEQQDMAALKQLIERHHGTSQVAAQKQQPQQQEEEQQQQQVGEKLHSSSGIEYVLSGFPSKSMEDAYMRHKTDTQLRADLAAVALRLVIQTFLALKAHNLLKQAHQGQALRVRPSTLQAGLLAANLLCAAPCLVAVVWFRSSYWRVRNVSMMFASLVALLSAALVLYASRSTHTSVHAGSSSVQRGVFGLVLVAGKILLPPLQQPTTKTLVFMTLLTVIHTHCVAKLLELSCAAEVALVVGVAAAQALVLWWDLRLRRRFCP